MPVAAVDVGTNSVRLLVLDDDGRRLTRELTITRLGQGVDRNGHLDDDALQRTLDALAHYRQVWEGHGVTDRVRIAATSAVRDAADRDRFFAGVRQTTGVDAEVISGSEEAALAFAGASGAVDVTPPTMVLDVGGGSTELIVGDPDGTVLGEVSLQLGCVRLTERHLSTDPPTAAQLIEARRLVLDQLAQAAADLRAAGVDLSRVGSLIGVAGTATTLAALHLGLDAYREEAIHGTRIPADALRELTEELCAMTVAERAALGPVQAGREDVLHGGALIIAGVLEEFGFAEVMVSESDGLDGLAQSLQ